MTINGKHTIIETRDLMKTIEFRKSKNDEVFAKIPPSKDPRYLDLLQDKNNWDANWSRVRDKVADELVELNIGQPLVPADIITSESQYQKIRCANNKGCGDTWAKGDLMDIMIRTEQLSGITFDEKDAPAPTNFDPDLLAFKKVDQAIKSGEAAADAAAKKGKELAKTNTGLMVAGGIGLVVLGGVLAKVYLPKF